MQKTKVQACADGVFVCANVNEYQAYTHMCCSSHSKLRDTMLDFIDSSTKHNTLSVIHTLQDNRFLRDPLQTT